jgi:hypothetical protein
MSSARATSDTGSWAHVKRARVGHGELGPAQPSRLQARLLARARHVGHGELGRYSPARLQAALLGPCSARHVGHGHGELGPCRGSPAGRARATSDTGAGRGATRAPPGSPARAVQCAPRRTRTRGTGPASRLACWAGTARATSDTGSWAWSSRARLQAGLLGPCSARHVGHGKLGASRLACWACTARHVEHGGLGAMQPRAPPGSPAGPRTSDTESWVTGRPAPVRGRVGRIWLGLLTHRQTSVCGAHC